LLFFNEADELALKKEYVESKGMIFFAPRAAAERLKKV
jgi:hypothetical protein